MTFNLHGEHVTLGVYEPSYNPFNVYQGLVAYGHATVGPGVEFPNVAALPNTGHGVATEAAINVTANSLTIALSPSLEGAHITNEPYNGYVLAFQGKADIVGMRLLSTDISGIDAAHVHFNGHQVFINGSGLDLPAGEQAYATFGFRFANFA